MDHTVDTREGTASTAISMWVEFLLGQNITAGLRIVEMERSGSGLVRSVVDAGEGNWGTRIDKGGRVEVFWVMVEWWWENDARQETGSI